MDMEKGMCTWVPSALLLLLLSALILITFKETNVPESVSMYNGLVKIPVRLYVDSVVQCFQCYGFGHWKDICKKERVCIICGEEFHGRCDRKEKCEKLQR